MNQSEATKIFNVWTKWSYPYHQLLFSIFQSQIPESFLPYPKHLLEEALNDVSKYYFDSGNYEYSKAIQNTISFLMFYSKDEDALINSAKCFSIPEMANILTDSITRFKNEWVEWIKNKEGSVN
jgi:hypothetical protein